MNPPVPLFPFIVKFPDNEFIIVKVFPLKTISFALIVTVSFTVRVLPSAMVSVDPVAGAVIVTLLIVIAVATPSDGVVNDGDTNNA